jgi:ABC-type sugar transport system permease subunit
MQLNNFIEKNKKRSGKGLKKFLAAHAHLPYVGPISIWIILFVIAPLCVVLYFSFLTRSPVGKIINIFTLENYQNFFQGKYYTVPVFRLSNCLLDSKVWRKMENYPHILCNSAFLDLLSYKIVCTKNDSWKGGAYKQPYTILML